MSELGMQWLKSIHVIFMITWFSGLFYLPRLYVYHAMSTDTLGIERFKIMERKLYYGITYPGGIITTITGLSLLYLNQNLLANFWMKGKLTFVCILWLYHLSCGYYLKKFKHDNNTHTHVFYRWFNEFPVVILFVVIPLIMIQPK